MDKKFRTMVERSVQGIVIIQDFRIVYTNQASAKMTGFSKTELLQIISSLLNLQSHHIDDDKVTDVFLDINKAIPCGLIVNELVSNSLKHAFPQDKKGNIRIQLNRGNNGNVRFVVSDNGIGFSEKVDFQNPDSLGLQLVNDLVDQLGGTLELDSSEGTSYQISFST